MSIDDFRGQGILWRFRLSAGVVDLIEDPGVELPGAWAGAVVAVARDLRCSRHGRDIEFDQFTWHLLVNTGYAVEIGWRGPGMDGFDVGLGAQFDAPFGEAAVCVADAVQTELAGNEFVQWPSQGARLLRPQLADGQAQWLDPTTKQVVAAIGGLCP